MPYLYSEGIVQFKEDIKRLLKKLQRQLRNLKFSVKWKKLVNIIFIHIKTNKY